MNNVVLIGKLSNREISTTRTSGTTDIIPVNTNQEGYVRITGTLRTHNTPDRHLKMYVQPTSITPTYDLDENAITLSGYVCKTPIYRTTPSGREITDLLIADGNNYIPCVVWEDATEYTIGDYITIEGRIQSREYIKNGEIKRTYEVSVNSRCKN